MHNSTLRAWLDSSPLAGDNHSYAYIEGLYTTYLTDAEQVSEDWRILFDGLRHSALPQAPPPASDKPTAQMWQLLALMNAFRTDGHRQAALDPLKRRQPTPLAQLQLAFHHFTPADLATEVEISSLPVGLSKMSLGDLHGWLQQIYCGAIGAETMHLSSVEQRNWLQQRLESASDAALFTQQRQCWLLEQLTAADGLERYLAAKFPGAKRFSLEGGDSLIPLLNHLVIASGQQGVAEILLGMAHRGRLNVLVNVLGKKPADLIAEFAGKRARFPGSSDVKYHQGFSSVVKGANGAVAVTLLPNPSHLEIVSPVVMGVARARQDQRSGKQGGEILAVTVHGDSAIAGQGVVQETFNLSQVAGYSVGGTIRIVINNQIGFTTTEQDARSSYYCTDIAKVVEAPVLHVNGDDPQAVIVAAQIAFDFRRTFKRDVVIDLICYRRHGHNEADEPSATQPLMYHCIKQHPTPRSVYAERLVTSQRISAKQVDTLITDYRAALEQGDSVVDVAPADSQTRPVVAGGDLMEVIPTVTRSQLQALGARMCHYPEGFLLHDRVAKIYRDRLKMVMGEQRIDWGAAETLAYATLLTQGIDVRLSGQDSGRGTFFHRHAVLHHQQEPQCYTPLANLQPEQGRFFIWDSVLSEVSVLAFEYGYASAAPNALVIWEAQFGDFANGAQVVIDQFISAGEQKWGQRAAITLLLPHGYEGQGPEHSSARLERYLQLCAEENMAVCVPSNAAQIYHLLRRQALQSIRRPLVILSPKSLLRHSLASVTLSELAESGFQTVLGEVDELDSRQVKQIVLCSGKIYYDLLEQRRRDSQGNQQNAGEQAIALLRIEQLYPFPDQPLQRLLAHYPQVRSIVWCQEEPMNQGAWLLIQSQLQALAATLATSKAVGSVTVRVIARSAAAATAVGYLAQHQQQQQALIDQALSRTAADASVTRPRLLQESGVR